MVKSTSTQPPAPTPDADPADLQEVDEVALLAERVRCAELRLRAVEELLDVGMELTRDLRERALAGQARGPAHDPAREGDAPQGDAQKAGAASDTAAPDYAGEFARLSRAVRLTLAMHARFDDALSALHTGKAAAVKARRERRERAAGQAAQRAEEERRETLEEAVTEQVLIAIAREAESEREYDERFLAMCERLEWDAAYDEMVDRPFRDIVEQLCKELCLTPDWSDWTEKGWPIPPPIGSAARPVFSPFHQPSPRPLLKSTVERQRQIRSSFELADQPP
jgi:hypothetical protein